LSIADCRLSIAGYAGGSLALSVLARVRGRGNRHDWRFSPESPQSNENGGDAMPTVESFHVDANELLGRVKELLHEGNVRRIIIRQGTRTVAEFPLTIGIVGAALAPILVAVGALAAVLTDCTIVVERKDPGDSGPTESKPDGA
jgi:Domain of unknown function (DUF4342)